MQDKLFIDMDGYRASFELAECRRSIFEMDNLDYGSILSVNLNDLKFFAEHNLEALKSGKWSSFRGTEFSDGDPVEGDVENALRRYEIFLKAVGEQSEGFEEILEFSIEFFQWMYEKEDNLSLYENEDLYCNDFYHEIIRTVADMTEGNYSEIKMFIEDNRHMEDWMDEAGNLMEDLREGLDRFEHRIHEIEECVSLQRQNYCMKKRTSLH